MIRTLTQRALISGLVLFTLAVPEPVRAQDEPPAPAETVTADEAPSVDPGACDDLGDLEPVAMLGELEEPARLCLEWTIGTTTSKKDRERASRLLMTDSYSRAAYVEWDVLVKRHLEEIEATDADLMYKYALYLARRGPERSWGVIKWADAALEHDQAWKGGTRKERVFKLYELRATAATTLWKQAEERYASEPEVGAAADSGDTDLSASGRPSKAQKRVDEMRERAKTYAREWFDYGDSIGDDTAEAAALCIAAGGTTQYCSGA